MVDVQRAVGVAAETGVSLRIDLAIFQSAIAHHEDQLNEIRLYAQKGRGLLVANFGEAFKARTLLWDKEPQTGRI
jgi:hypothetical protein